MWVIFWFGSLPGSSVQSYIWMHVMLKNRTALKSTKGEIKRNSSLACPVPEAPLGHASSPTPSMSFLESGALLFFKHFKMCITYNANKMLPCHGQNSDIKIMLVLIMLSQ
jgi:hypothetical protein